MDEIIKELVLSMRKLNEKDLMYILGLVSGMAIKKEESERKDEY